MFAKNERGYRLNAIKKRVWSLLILVLSVASIRRKLLKTTNTEERSVHTNSALFIALKYTPFHFSRTFPLSYKTIKIALKILQIKTSIFCLFYYSNYWNILKKKLHSFQWKTKAYRTLRYTILYKMYPVLWKSKISYVGVVEDFIRWCGRGFYTLVW